MRSSAIKGFSGIMLLSWANLSINLSKKFGNKLLPFIFAVRK